MHFINVVKISSKQHKNVSQHFMNNIINYIFLLSSTSFAFATYSQTTDSVKVKTEFLVPAKQNKWINDFEDLFTKAQERTLDSLITSFEKATTNEIAIVTFNSASTETNTDNFDNFVLAIHNYWGVGKKGANNGIVIGICTDLRKIRISNGYGIEKRLTGHETTEIIDEIITPEFKKGLFFKGVHNGLLALFSKLQ